MATPSTSVNGQIRPVVILDDGSYGLLPDSEPLYTNLPEPQEVYVGQPQQPPANVALIFSPVTIEGVPVYYMRVSDGNP